MRAQREKMHGLNLNPLAPAQSKLAFPFSRKTRKFIEHACIWAPFFYPFGDLFHDFSLKVARRSRVPPRSLKKTPKWTPKGDQMETRGVKVQHQGYKKCGKSTTCSPRVPKRSPGCYNRAPRSLQMQNTQKKITQIAKKTY